MTDLVKIKSIRKIKTVNTKIYDLGVPDYHTFILEDGTVVHNCDTGQSLKAKIIIMMYCRWIGLVQIIFVTLISISNQQYMIRELKCSKIIC